MIKVLLPIMLRKNLFQLFTKISILRRQIIHHSSSNIYLCECFFDFRKRHLQNFICVPACVIQIKEAHLIYVVISKEDFFRTEIGVHKLFWVKYFSQGDYFESQVDGFDLWKFSQRWFIQKCILDRLFRGNLLNIILKRFPCVLQNFPVYNFRRELSKTENWCNLIFKFA